VGVPARQDRGAACQRGGACDTLACRAVINVYCVSGPRECA
jgi:hypothetical protein